MLDKDMCEYLMKNLTEILRSEFATGEIFQSKVIESLKQKKSNFVLVEFCKNVMESL